MSAAARSEMQREKVPQPYRDVPLDLAIREGLAWLGRAQDHSASADGGVARHFCLVTGWGASYPECTGYIVPTLIREAHAASDQSLLERSRRMLDWLIAIQMPCGAFQGGLITDAPAVPVTFNTGQILLGLAAGATEFGTPYCEAMTAAADWMVKTQDSDGCWRRYPTPYAEPGEKVYETHAAWGLFEAARLKPNSGYAEAAVRNVYWALRHQQENGWFDRNCLTTPSEPLTHTIGYVLRGLIEAYHFTGDRNILKAALKTATGVLQALGSNGFLPGRLDSRWCGTVSWACLTGTAQMAICWLMLYRETGDSRFRRAAFAANRFVRRTVSFEGADEVRGAVKGSFPVAGEYLKFQYPNWACKFFIDANSLEKAVREEEGESLLPLSAETAVFAH